MTLNHIELLEAVARVQASYNVADRPVVSFLTDTASVGAFIKGTNNADDVVKDVEATQIKIPFCTDSKALAHDGFLDASKGIATRVAQVTKLGDRIIVAGHSLGGAVATIVAWELTTMGYRNITVYTFGSPRVFNKEAAAIYEAQVPNTYRFVHAYDAVPTVPWWWTYTHVGQLIRINAAGDELPEHKGLFGLMRDIMDHCRRDIEDHYMDKYVAAVIAYCGKNQ
jgi:predicted lipase